MSSIKCYMQGCLQRTWRWTCCGSQRYCCLSSSAYAMKGSEPSIGSGQSGQSGHHSSSISKRSLLSQDNLTYGSTTKPSNGTAANAERKSTSESEISSMTAPKPIQKQPVSNKSSNSNTDIDGAADDDNSKYADNNNKFVNSKKGGADDVVDNCTPNDIQIESILNCADIVKKQTTVYSNGAVTRTIVGATTDEDDVFPSVHRRLGSSCGAKQNVVNAVDNESTDIFPDNRDAVIATSARKAAIVVPLAKRKDSMVGKDGHYFIALTNKQRELITARSDKVEAYLQSDNINEEASGKIRAAIGKAHLLMSQKFKQFLGLCDDNLHPKEDGPTTTIQDLAGFWDLVLIQIDDVESNFDEIEEMKKVGWNEVDETQFKKRTSSCSSQKSVNGTETPEPKTPTRTRMPKRQMKPKTPAEKAREETARKTREEARRRLMQAKREARKRLLSGEHGDKEVEIFVPETTS